MRRGVRTVVDPETVEKARLLYAGDELTNAEIGAKFGKAPNWINGLVAKFKWPLRGKNWRPGKPHGQVPASKSSAYERQAPKPKRSPRDNASVAAANRAEEEAQFRRRYGALLPDVLVLQAAGFVVDKVRGGYRVGNDVVTAEELQAKAARERRLGVEVKAGVRRPTAAANGLKIGERVPIAPKAKTAWRPSAAELKELGLAPAPPIDTTTAVPARRAREPSTLPARPARGNPRALAAPTAPARRALHGAAAAASERAAVHSTDLGTRPRVVWLDLAILQVDHRYQREIAQAGQAHVNRLLRAFNWNCYQPIIVSERADGSYAVIDGQHRLEAARKHPLIAELPCYIVDAPSVAAQAAIFSTVNGRRLGLTSQQKFWAAHAAGDETAVAVDRICRKHGVTILRGVPSYDIPPRSVLAPFTLQKVLTTIGKSALDQAIGLLAETQGSKPNGFRSPTIAALARIAAAKEFGRARWVRVLKAIDTDKLYDEARTERVTGGGTLETATERVLKRYADAAAGGAVRAAA